MRMESIKRKFLIALFLFICIVMHAQDLVVQGTVLSAVDNFPVIDHNLQYVRKVPAAVQVIKCDDTA